MKALVASLILLFASLGFVVWAMLLPVTGCVTPSKRATLSDAPQIMSQDDALAMFKAEVAAEIEKLVEADLDLHAEATVKGVETHKDITYGAGDVWTSRIWAIGATLGMPIALWFGWKLKCRQNKHGQTGGGQGPAPLR